MLTEEGNTVARGRTAADRKPTDLKETLWRAADKLRGSMDAAEYKHFVLGLVFLKYVSDAFEERRDALKGELAEEGITGERAERLLEDADEYTGQGVFWVPSEARWSSIVVSAKSEVGAVKVGQIIDGAMNAIEKYNPDLTGVLPKIFNRTNVDERRLSELVDLIGRIGFRNQAGRARDVLGEVYEYCLEKFATAEGKRGGEFYTPPSVVKVLVAMLEPAPKDRVYDPCCGSGGMFVQAERFIESHGGRPFDISVFGQELNENTWRLAKMNLAIHGIGADLGRIWGDSFFNDMHPDLRADIILANPPFNISDWGGERLVMDPRWTHGIPPVGNANFAWLQHIGSKMSVRGQAGVVLANGSMSSRQSGEGDIRRAMVEDDLVACLVALPPQLFRSTQIPACLWFLAKNKGPQGARRLTDRRGEVLFIDARTLGFMANRTERHLSYEEVARIADTYHAWRGTNRDSDYVDEHGFCYSAEVDEIRTNDFVLTPGRYVGTAEVEAESEFLSEKISRLTRQLFADFDESSRLNGVARGQLGRLDV
jgi:type I restriction enzyme M protein